MITHYLTTDVLAVNDSVKAQVTELMKEAAQKPRSAASIAIRLITFIPKQVIDHNASIFIPACNIVITKSDYEHLPLHPWSHARLMHDSKARLASQPANVISIDITDHDNNDASVVDDNLKIGRSFYMSIGDKVHKLSSSTDKITPSGATIVLKKQGSITDVITNIKLEDLPEHGIFTNEADAIYHGDNKLRIEDSRLQHDLKKLTLEKEKLRLGHSEYKKEAKLKRKKLKYDLEKLTIDKKNLEISSANEIKKLEHEVTKMSHELIMMAKKSAMETLANEYKSCGLVLDMSKTEMKHLHDINKINVEGERAKEKHQHEIKKINLESDRAREKHGYDMAKIHIDLVARSVGTAVSVLKNIINK
jgi:hypothetical protein